MKTGVFASLALGLVLLFTSCQPSLPIRSEIRHNEKSQCNYPLTYKSSSKWEVVKDSVNLHQTTPVVGSKEWENQYEVIKIVYHTFTSENGFGVRIESKSHTIVHQSGELEFNHIIR